MNEKLTMALGSGYILAAEDSLVQARRIKRFFEDNQLRAVVCKDGAEALETARSETPALIISDIMMPVMDGYTFCTEMKKDQKLRSVPFILLTSLGDPLDIIKGLQAGADNFITKPYDDTYLLSRIHYLLTDSQLSRQSAGDMSLEIVFQGQKFTISSEKRQILDLLLSVYEAAINRNEQLIQAQRQLQQLNEDLQAVNKELEAFAHTVSHDLRSPLTGVIGFAEILKADDMNLDDETTRSYLDSIIRSGRKMNQLISDLLDFSRTARSEIEPREVNLSELAREIADDLQKLSPSIKYEVHIEDNVRVQADPAMMRVMLNNLLGNAFKYSQKAENPRIFFGSIETDEKTVISVEDNGVGFEMSKADSIFRPFVRLHFNEEYQGTGVGLSTVKRIIERHGGAIWFESAPGEGTRFYFTIN